MFKRLVGVGRSSCVSFYCAPPSFVSSSRLLLVNGRRITTRAFTSTSSSLASTTTTTVTASLKRSKRFYSQQQQQQQRQTITFGLNGKIVLLNDVEPGTTILQYLRSTNVGLRGTKLGCEEGGCGACTVQLSQWDPISQTVIHRGVNACLALIHSADGHHIITVEGIGNTQNMHPIQEKMVYNHGSQCGFCTPGIVMALHSYMAAHPNATKQEVEHCLDGNLCRCTGYRPILDAAKRLVDEANPSSCGINNFSISGTTPAFPALLKDYPALPLHVQGKEVSWYRPVTLSQLLEIKSIHGDDAKIVGGSTELSIEVKFKHNLYPVLISPLAVPELNSVQVKSDCIEVGASVSLTNLGTALEDVIKNRPSWQTRNCQAILDQLRWFAGPQIKNVATLGGNIATASPISDITPVLVAIGARLKIQSKSGGTREVRVSSDFFVGYRRIAMDPREVIVSVSIPFNSEYEFVRAFKQSRRREDDIAIVSAGLRVLLEKRNQNKFVVKEATLAYGGMDAVTKDAPSTSQFLIGKEWNDDLLNQSYKYLEDDLPLADDAVGGMVPYRRTLSASFWFKFFMFVRKSVGLPVPPEVNNGIDVIPERPLTSSLQTYYHAKGPKIAPVGDPIPHVSSKKQVTGEAIYVDDIEMPTTGLYGYFVTSTKPHARILNVDSSEALKMDGVIAFFSAKDITGRNEISPVPIKGEELFASEIVHGVGYPLGVILASTPRQAELATLAVKVDYEELPHILTIPEAIKANSFFETPSELKIERGLDPDKVFPSCDFVEEGTMSMGGQEQFYLEPQVSHVVPGEDGEIIVYASTQNPTETQKIVAEVLGIPWNRVVCKVKRLGGGFGGKESRSIFVSCAAALCASKLHRPVRILLDRDDDMLMTGGRHPFMGKYKVGFSKEGLIQALDCELYSNAGWSLDLSISVMERAVFHIDNAYFIPNIRVKGFLCRTNITTNTAFRGFGGPQSMLVCESVMERISKVTGKHVNQVRRQNMYTEGQTTHYRQILKKHDVTASRCWDELIELCDFHRRSQQVDEWNKHNRFKKRGIAMIPTKFGLSFSVRVLNQAGALVHVYKDGSVLISHGGTEMGQGLHTKIIQVAANALQIPIDQIYISETATDKVANSSPTSASVQSDLNGGAVLNACLQINERLEPFKRANPRCSFKEIVSKAYIEQVNLSANGFYSRPYLSFNWTVGSGNPFAYFTTGAACSEVEIDCLTGDFQALRTDLVMDVGESLSPAIDIGQIEGAFAQGLGWTTMEDVVYLKNGTLYTRGPGTYKIPGFKDMPVDMRFHLLKDSPNPTTIYSSKGIGEPPLFLGSSVFFAIKEACYAFRAENGLNGWFPLSSPATCERIRMSCQDHLVKRFQNQ